MIELFGRQHWVAGVDQLEALGVPRRSARAAVRSGTVDRIVRGVLGIPGHAATFEGRCMTLQLAAGGQGYLSGRAAARLHGLRAMSDAPVEYTLDAAHRMHVPAWGRLVRSSWPDVERRPDRTDGLIVASPLRTLFGLAAELTDARFERAAEDAWHLGLVTPQDAAEYLDRVRRSGRTGVASLERWLERTSASSRPPASGLEQLLAALARRAGLPEPSRQYPLTLRSGVTIHLDLAWPDRRLALEPGHSWWHGGDLAQRADQDRDRQCGEMGWQVIRVDESAWTRQAEITGQLRRTYRSRAQAGGDPAPIA